MYWPGIILCSLLAILAATGAAAKTSAVSVPVRSKWYGYDGTWSPVSIRVGTPPQWIDVFVSTASQETWVIGPGGCDGTERCAAERGGNLFEANASTTWQVQGAYSLGLDPQLGFTGNGIYGLDSISLSDEISVPSQMIGIVNTTDYWLGYFGLGVEPTNFTSVDVPTFLDNIVENESLVPSHSYGYTSGAYYRLKKVPASLTLGGYDSNRFEPHNLSFQLDDAQMPVIAINEISVSAQPLVSSNESTRWDRNQVTLLQPAQADLFTIDSSTPFLWLPEAVCTQVEKTLGLTYDGDLELYTFGNRSGQYETLVNWNLTFQFTIADLPGSSNSLALKLPYAAFDLELTYPYPGLNATENSPPMKYFPLRKAINSTQYTIGRAFLQETYLVIDYERNNFSIYNAKFPPNALQDINLVDITRPENSTFKWPTTASASRLSEGAIAGVAVGSSAVLTLFTLGLYYSYRALERRINNQDVRDGNAYSKRITPRVFKAKVVRWLFRTQRLEMPAEIEGIDRAVYEAPNSKEASELASPTKPPSELEGGDCKLVEYQETKSKRVVCAIGHDPQKPVELPYSASDLGFAELEGAGQADKEARSCMSEHRRHTQSSMDVSSPSNTENREDSKSSSPTFVISPMTPRQASPEPTYNSIQGSQKPKSQGQKSPRRFSWESGGNAKASDESPSSHSRDTCSVTQT